MGVWRREVGGGEGEERDHLLPSEAHISRILLFHCGANRSRGQRLLIGRMGTPCWLPFCLPFLFFFFKLWQALTNATTRMKDVEVGVPSMLLFLECLQYVYLQSTNIIGTFLPPYTTDHRI